MNELDTRLLAAHAQGDQWALVALYTQAADQTNDINTVCFFLTYAYIYALELGHPDADALYARLDAHGRV